MPSSSRWFFISALLGGTSVIMGAFAAHGLSGKVEEKALEWVRTGSQYQLAHALALMGWALWLQSRSHGASQLPGWGFVLGSVVFSGTLYAMALGAPRWLGAITPIGGTLLIAAWLGFAVQSLKSSG